MMVEKKEFVELLHISVDGKLALWKAFRALIDGKDDVMFFAAKNYSKEKKTAPDYKAGSVAVWISEAKED